MADNISAEKEKELEADMRASLVDDRLPCPVAFNLSDKHSVSRKAVGDLANKLNIKIANCQLGCFP